MILLFSSTGTPRCSAPVPAVPARAAGAGTPRRLTGERQRAAERRAGHAARPRRRGALAALARPLARSPARRRAAVRARRLARQARLARRAGRAHGRADGEHRQRRRHERTRRRAEPATTTEHVIVLTEGAEGRQVQLLQRALGIAVDGIFGPETEEAVEQFQSSHGPDGRRDRRPADERGARRRLADGVRGERLARRRRHRPTTRSTPKPAKASGGDGGSGCRAR